MSPAPIPNGASAIPPTPSNTSSSSRGFDDLFHCKFLQIIEDYKNNPRTGPLTQRDRKSFIDTAYSATDEVFFGNRQLSDTEIKQRALTKVFYKVLADEPWSEDWIRPHDVERKLSRFEMHKNSIELAAEHDLHTPREAIAAARQHLLSSGPGTGKPRGPYDDIEIIYIPGTVSSTATNKIDREQIYPVSVASVAHCLQSHICRDMTRPFLMAEKFVSCTDTDELIKMRKFACDVCDYAPHLLDNDNISLLIVLLILTRSEVCKRFENNGIRIEGSTISHRRAECMKQKLGWKTSDDRKPFDNVANEFQTRVRNAVYPSPRPRITRTKSSRKSSTPATLNTPPVGYPPLQSPFAEQGMVHVSPRIPPPLNFPNVPLHSVAPPLPGPGSTPAEPMDIS